MSTENLTSKDALDKMTSLVDDIKFAMLLTDLDTQPISAAPMTTKKVDHNGDIWFLSGLSSDHNTNILKSPAVQLLYSDPSDKEFISIYGKAEIVTDKQILEDLFSRIDEAWFNGVDDPNLTAIKVVPEEAYFWDSKENKYTSLFKMGLAALTGNKQDIGRKGKLNL